MLEDASVEPPAFLWNEIEEKLPHSSAWHKKRRYAILLLLLTFIGSGGYYIYKSNIGNDTNKNIALNKRIYKDEVSPKYNKYPKKLVTTSTNSTDSNSIDAQKIKSNLNEALIAQNNTPVSKTTVSDFYQTDKNGVETKASITSKELQEKQAKKEARLERLDVSNSSENTNETTLADNSINPSVLKNSSKKSKTIHRKNEHALDAYIASTTEQTDATSSNSNVNSSKNNPTNVKSNSDFKQDAIKENSKFKPTKKQDITEPISEPIRNSISAPLLASAVPVKLHYTPLSSRDVLRSLVNPEKLEEIDLESQAVGIDNLSPNMDKMLKNLKQFSGYDINKGFHFGAFILINNIWLNKKQFSADENTQSIKPMLTFGKAYGVNIGYDFIDRWGVQLEWQISEQGQKYKIQQADGSHTKDINLLYTKFPIVAKYKQTFNNNYNAKPIALSFVFGPQLGVLIKKSGKLDGTTISNLPAYSNVELGLLSGFDFDLFMTRNVAMTIGARTGFMSPMKRNKPMSFQLGVTTQFNFRFPKKIK